MPNAKFKRDVLSDRLTEALHAFLAAPPEGTSSQVLDEVRDAIRRGHTLLPPRLFFEVVEQAEIAVSITDLHADILYTNPAFSRVTGYDAEEIIGENEACLSAKNTPPTVYKTLWANLAAKRPWNGLLVNQRKDGERYLADLTIVPVLNIQGDTAYFLGIHRDVTELHTLEQALRNQKAMVESMVDSAHLLIALLDDDERIVLDNHAYKKLYGDMHRAEPARAFLDAIRADLGEQFEHMLGKPGLIANLEVPLDMGPGRETRWFNCSVTRFTMSEVVPATYFEGPKQRDFLLVIADEITLRRKTNEAAKRNALMSLLSEQERVLGMRETLEAAVFQMQGPLNLMQAARNMLDLGVDPMTLKAALDDALAQGHALTELLTAATPAQYDESTMNVDLNALIGDVLGLFTGTLLRTGIIVDWTPLEPSPVASVRPHRMRAVIKQLIENAIDAMDVRAVRERVLSIRCEPDGDEVLIGVADTGPGIPRELRARVFEPFFSTKGARGRSAGMGLSMVHATVGEHGGAIDIDTRYHDGCRMLVRLPRSVGFLGAVVGGAGN